MSRQPNDKPAWAAKIIRILNSNQRDLIAIQRSVIRIEASIMTNETPNRSIGRNYRVNPIGPRPNQPIRQQNIGNNTPAHPNRGRQLLNEVANQPIQQRPCLQHRNFGHAADVRQCNANCNFLALNPRPAPVNNRPLVHPIPGPVNNRPLAHPIPGPVENQQMAIDRENELEENLLNLSDTE